MSSMRKFGGRAVVLLVVFTALCSAASAQRWLQQLRIQEGFCWVNFFILLLCACAGME